jgi:hypothetical protein
LCDRESRRNTSLEMGKCVGTTYYWG